MFCQKFWKNSQENTSAGVSFLKNKTKKNKKLRCKCFSVNFFHGNLVNFQRKHLCRSSVIVESLPWHFALILLINLKLMISYTNNDSITFRFWSLLSLKELIQSLYSHTRFFIRKLFFCLNPNFFNIMLEIRLRFS